MQRAGILAIPIGIRGSIPAARCEFLIENGFYSARPGDNERGKVHYAGVLYI